VAILESPAADKRRVLLVKEKMSSWWSVLLNG